MGTQFTPNSIPRNIIIIMKFLAVLSMVAGALASPIEVTPEVADATAAHLAAHAAATAGEHAALAPAAVASQYLADAEDVAAAKAEFEKLFKAAEAGTPIIPALPAPVAPIAAHQVYNPIAVNPHPAYYGGYYAGYHGLAGYPYAGYPYAGYPYAGYPFGGLPFALTAPAATEE